MKKYPWRHKLEELFGLDLRAMAFLRVAFACIILTDLIQRAFHMGRDYTDYGTLPRSLFWAKHLNAVSIHLMTGSLGGQVFLFIVAGIAALGMLLGYRTRFCTIVSWMLLVSLDARNSLILNGGDIYLGMVLFWGMFLPWGQKYSIDGLRDPGRDKNVNFSSLATFGFILQVCVVYFFSGSLKNGSQWRDGTALYYILSADDCVKPFGQLLLHYPTFLSAISNYVPYFEKFVALLLVFPFFTPYFRLAAVELIILLHLGLLATIELGLFSLICITAAIGLLPKDFWDILPLPNWPNTNKEDANTSASGQSKSSLINVLLTGVLIYIVLYNVSTLPHSHLKLPKTYKTLGKILHLNQYWNMYSPGIPTFSGWYVMKGSLKNGQEINVQSGGPVDFNRPQIVYKTYRGERDRNLIFRIRNNPDNDYRIYYARFLCRDWDLSHKGDKQMNSIQVFFMQQDILLNNLKTPPKKRSFIDYICP